MAKEPVPLGHHGCFQFILHGLGRGQGDSGQSAGQPGCCAGREEGPPTQEPHGLKAARRLEQDGGGSQSQGSPGGHLPPPWDLARGGVLHRLDWQQDMVVRDPSTVLLMA